jgi:hypothetical protein
MGVKSRLWGNLQVRFDERQIDTLWVLMGVKSRLWGNLQVRFDERQIDKTKTDRWPNLLPIKLWSTGFWNM